MNNFKCRHGRYSQTHLSVQRDSEGIGIAPLGCTSPASNEMDPHDTQEISHSRSFNNSLWAFKLTASERSGSDECAHTPAVPKPLGFAAKILYRLLVLINNISTAVGHSINPPNPQKVPAKSFFWKITFVLPQRKFYFATHFCFSYYYVCISFDPRES